jgi:hypothetical protein
MPEISSAEAQRNVGTHREVAEGAAAEPRL